MSLRSFLLLAAVVVAAALAASPSGAGPKRCVVPKVVGLHVVAARAYIVSGGCRVGRVVRVGSVVVGRRRVIAQSPKPRRRLPPGTRVHLVVSAGTPKR